MSKPSKRAGTGLFSTIRSVAAAAFGVQSSANRERDFSHGKPSHFIIAGIIGTIFFSADHRLVRQGNHNHQQLVS